jgi:DNA-binding NarL/FixJ family response regulator
MKTIVIAKDLHPLFMSAVHFLHRSDITVHTAATADELLTTHFEHHAVLLVTRLDLPGIHCETMISVIRRNEALKSVSILVLYTDDPVQRARSARCGANIVMAMPADPGVLATHVSQLLSVEPRRTYRVVMNMAAHGVHQNRPFLCKSENISPKGLLIRTTEVLAPGSRIACSFYLPDGTHVSADGDVARVIKQGFGDEAHHYGVRFISIAPEAEASISSFVHK